MRMVAGATDLWEMARDIRQWLRACEEAMQCAGVVHGEIVEFGFDVSQSTNCAIDFGLHTGDLR